ncbi:iron-sulfur cluster co-chaperone protein HscB isoform X4 [Equus caballus]|uniref:iron-sulfur cluster co-chaperone protein HscB isoform X4 n=1 Tax=Equus caballus TaxID=9796 RepID=UPI000717D9A0|nr:iron-sulfur cluster co-chaperone protein HscB, mitochondrial isoform X4 [Equus caballus]
MWGGRAGALLRVWGLWPAGVLGRRPLSCNAASLAGSNPSGCWNCGSPGGPVRGDGFFCPQCRALQPPDLTRDYFSLMDCNRSFRVDTAKLQQRYQQLQRLVHPDFFSQRSQLKLRGVEIPEGTDYEMDRQFLMEIMEMNEKLAEAQSEAAMKEIESVVRAKQKELTDNVSRAFERGQSMEDARVLVDFLSGPSTSSSKYKSCPFMICGGVEFFEVYIKLCGFRSWRKGATVRQAESQ